jgi:branched-chain amino acid transport system permease protein
MIGGYVGYADFGHAVFIGIGAYVVGILIARFGISDLAFRQRLPLAFLVGAVFAGLIGFPTLRLKGPYFAVAALGILAMTREIAHNLPDLTQGGIGIGFDPPFPPILDVYYVMLLLVGLIFFMSLWIFRSQFGHVLRAIAQDEIGADTRGINTTTAKVSIFILAGGFTAMIGATRAYWQGYVTPDVVFPEDYTVQMIAMTLLGGIGRPWGPVIGGTAFFALQTLIPAVNGEIQLILVGLLLIIVSLYIPRGILGVLDPENRGLLWFFRRRSPMPDSQRPDIPPILPEFRATELQSSRHTQPAVLLEGRGITRDFGGIRAINKIDFKIYQGEIVGLLGPNGSGKTTLFNNISGILRPSSGELYLNGEDITRLSPWQISRYGLARTFEQIRVFEDLTLRENMLVARKWRGVPAWAWMMAAPVHACQRADELLELLGLAPISDALAGSANGSQQRLLEIGMALMSDPLLMLLDEATSGINPSVVKDIQNSIVRLNRELGLTFFVIEHNLNFAMDLCHRLYVLDHGSVIAEGTPQELKHNPAVIEAYFGREE